MGRKDQPPEGNQCCEIPGNGFGRRVAASGRFLMRVAEGASLVEGGCRELEQEGLSGCVLLDPDHALDSLMNIGSGRCPGRLDENDGG